MTLTLISSCFLAGRHLNQTRSTFWVLPNSYESCTSCLSKYVTISNTPSHQSISMTQIMQHLVYIHLCWDVSYLERTVKIRPSSSCPSTPLHSNPSPPSLQPTIVRAHNRYPVWPIPPANVKLTFTVSLAVMIFFFCCQLVFKLQAVSSFVS